MSIREEIRDFEELNVSAEAEKKELNHKTLEWERKYDKANVSPGPKVHEVMENRWLADAKINELQAALDEKSVQLEKWRPTLLESTESLKFLHQIFPVYAMPMSARLLISIILLMRRNSLPREDSRNPFLQLKKTLQHQAKSWQMAQLNK